MILQTIQNRLANVPYLIMSHRGFWGGNVIENSIESSILAVKAGADIVEVDVCRTSNGHYYLFHDGSELRLLNLNENFKTLSSATVDQTILLNSLGVPSGYKVTKLADFLAWLPENVLVNLDRTWEYWEDPEFFRILTDSGKEPQLFLKSPVQPQWLDAFASNGYGFSYVPIVHSREEWQIVLSYQTVRTVGMELIIRDLQSELLTNNLWLEKIKESGRFIVGNAENLGMDFNLFGGITDNTGLFQDEKWGKFVQSGMTVIQTDWPNFLSEYRKKQMRLVNR